VKRYKKVVKVSRETFLDYYDRCHSIDEKTKEKLLERNIEIFKRKLDGETHAKIAERFNMSRANVTVILKKMSAHALWKEKHRGRQVEHDLYNWNTQPLRAQQEIKT
jgi:predicted transcriptional regulator